MCIMLGQLNFLRTYAIIKFFWGTHIRIHIECSVGWPFLRPFVCSFIYPYVHAVLFCLTHTQMHLPWPSLGVLVESPSSFLAHKHFHSRLSLIPFACIFGAFYEQIRKILFPKLLLWIKIATGTKPDTTTLCMHESSLNKITIRDSNVKV